MLTKEGQDVLRERPKVEPVWSWECSNRPTHQYQKDPIYTQPNEPPPRACGECGGDTFNKKGERLKVTRGDEVKYLNRDGSEAGG
jgi:hypothetical protein